MMLGDKLLSFFMIKRRHRYQAVPTNASDVKTILNSKNDTHDTHDMATLRKFRLILWKNWLFRKRQYVVTFFEILLPTLFSVLLLYLRNVGGDQFTGHDITNFTTYPKRHVLHNVVTNPAKILLYAPNNSISRDLLHYIINSSYLDPPLTLKGVANDDEMDAMAMQDTNKSLVGISFTGLGNSLPDKLHYRIRLSSGSRWYTNVLAPPSPPPGPVTALPPYRDSIFLILQHFVALRFIEISTGRGKLNSTDIYLQRYPYPPYFDDEGYSSLLQNMLPLFIALSYVFISPTLIKHIVREKELGVKELMKLMGLPGWLQWCGWFVSSFIVMTISAIIIVVLLSCDWFGIKTVLTHTAPELFFLILMLYVASSICFCFVIATFFSKPTLATACGVVVWLMTFFIPYYNLNQKYEELSLFVKLLVMLLPNMSMAWATRFMVAFEGRNLNLGWENLLDNSYPGDNMTLMHVIGVLIFDIFLYSFLTWYLDHVLPSLYGVRRPWYFLFTSTYWCRGAIKHEVDEDTSRRKSVDFEADPVGLKANVEITHLTKRYGWRETGKLAVNNLSLNMYEGQITALLGHNGAGKTTTMSMLTGMFPPTSGTAFINKCDIRTEIDDARQELGLCPQHNMLFNNLTVKEHFQFFGSLKITSKKVLDSEITMLLEKLQLTDKRNTFTMKLSGGMKRKVNLGIALIGGPKVVMLDEPTSGMDPEARRAIWDLLQEYRVGRTIVLTTHFMEEADVLADRIAIMTSGDIVCSGTPIFLKNRYGAGYHLNISKRETFDLNKISALIQEHIEGAYMSSNSNTEVSFVLPTDQSHNFPALFKHLEVNMVDFGATNFGISVTTMEEVFLKVGENTESQSDYYTSDNGSRNCLAPASRRSAITDKNTGYALWAEQMFGLFLKRWFYARRRWILLFAQILLPVLMIFTVLKLNNNIALTSASEPARVMDISEYGSTTAFINEDGPFKHWYGLSFPKDTDMIIEHNPTKYIENLSVKNYPQYLKNYIIGAEFPNSTDNFEATAWYNGMYYHTLPLSLNVLHNAMIKFYGNSNSFSLTVENAPLPSSEEDETNTSRMLTSLQAVMIGIFVPIGLSFLSSSFVVFPIHERATRSKHLQLMTGVGGSLFWGASFLWDFITHIVCCSIVVIIFITVDNTGAFTGEDRTGILVLLLYLFGWSSIPFTYLASFVASVPATGFSRLTIINLIAGIILSVTVYFVKSTTGGDWIYVLEWCSRLLPNFTITLALMNMVQISTGKQMCEKMAPLPCPPTPSYFQWDAPGLLQEIITLIVTGIAYFLILAVVERGMLIGVWYSVRNVFRRKTNNVAVVIEEEMVGSLDSDVAAERKRVHTILADGTEDKEVILVHDLKKQFGNFVAVDGVNFAVGDAECFGLLGVNGAGKTTTFEMLTGNLVVTEGNAYIIGINLRDDRQRYLTNIGYCPQFNALLDYLTGKEMLKVFAHLRGVPRSEIDQIVDAFVEDFDLQQYAQNITLEYSGGNKRKLSAALAFMGDPPIVFLDEPTTGVDPVARRKIWDILTDANSSGMSVILTSHSMEECEVLCSRVAIMVSGQFRCFGGIQYLKNKFSQGFIILAKLKRVKGSEDLLTERQQNLQEFMEQKFPSAALKDVHQGMVHYQVTDTNTKWTYLFETMETAKSRFELEDYSVSQASLEQVFLSFARKERMDGQSDKKND